MCRWLPLMTPRLLDTLCLPFAHGFPLFTSAVFLFCLTPCRCCSDTALVSSLADNHDLIAFLLGFFSLLGGYLCCNSWWVPLRFTTSSITEWQRFEDIFSVDVTLRIFLWGCCFENISVGCCFENTTLGCSGIVLLRSSCSDLITTTFRSYFRN